MFDPVLLELLKKFSEPSPPSGPPKTIRLEIPRDHPKAAALVKLAGQLAEQQQLQSGLIVKRLARPGAVEALLEFIEREFGYAKEEVFAELSLSPPAGKIDESLRQELIGRALPLIKKH